MEKLLVRYGKYLCCILIPPGGFYLYKQHFSKIYNIDGDIKNPINPRDEEHLTKLIGQLYYFTGLNSKYNIQFYTSLQPNVVSTGSTKFKWISLLGIPHYYLPSYRQEFDQNKLEEIIEAYKMNESKDENKSMSRSHLKYQPFQHPYDFEIAREAYTLYNSETMLKSFFYCMYIITSISTANFITEKIYQFGLDNIKKVYASAPSQEALVQNLLLYDRRTFYELRFKARTLRVAYPLTLIFSFITLFFPYYMAIDTYNIYSRYFMADDKVAKISPQSAACGIAYLKQCIEDKIHYENQEQDKARVEKTSPTNSKKEASNFDYLRQHLQFLKLSFKYDFNDEYFGTPLTLVEFKERLNRVEGVAREGKFLVDKFKPTTEAFLGYTI